MNRNAIVLVLTVLIAASKYHLKEMKRAHDHGWNGGWEAGKQFARGEFNDQTDDTNGQNEQ